MKFTIFDFDDTLVKTTTKIIVFGRRGTKVLSSAEFAVYKAEPDDKFDFSQFEDLINPKAIPKYVEKLRQAVNGGGRVLILTARANAKPVAIFLRDVGVTRGVAIVALGVPDPNRKKEYIETLITQKGATDIEFYDDSPKNIQAVQSLTRQHPDVRLKVIQVPSVHQ